MKTRREEIQERMTQIKPCPFCGEELHIRNSINPYAHCKTVGCHSNRAPVVALDDQMQVSAWNRRAPDPIREALVEALKHCRRELSYCYNQLTSRDMRRRNPEGSVEKALNQAEKALNDAKS